MHLYTADSSFGCLLFNFSRLYVYIRLFPLVSAFLIIYDYIRPYA